MFGSSDDFVLEGFADVVEVVAVSGDADDEAAVFFGVRLRVAQRLRVHDVELDMVAVHLEVCAHEAHHLADSGFVLQQLRSELLVKQRPAGAEVVHLADGFDHRRGPVRIRPLHGRNPFRERHPGMPSVRQRADDGAEIDMYRGGQQVDAVRSALRVRASVHRAEVYLEQAAHNGIRVVVVVAVFRRLVDEHQACVLVPFEIFLQSFEEGGHIYLLMIEDIPLKRGERIRERPQPYALDV